VTPDDSIYSAIISGDWKNFIGIPPMFMTNGMPIGLQFANEVSSLGR
jgi:hypothetical protein